MSRSTYVPCPLCGRTFAASAPGGGSVTIGRESDLCPKFPGRPADGARRLRAEIIMCPGCSFAARSGDFRQTHLSPATRHDVEERLQDDGLLRVFSRNDPSWLPFHAAEVCGKARNLPARELADICLRASWVCRKEKDHPFESTFQLRATRHFMRSLEEDFLDDRELSVTTYLVGELNRRLGRNREALNWYVNAGRTMAESRNENLAWLDRLIEKQRRLAEEQAA